MEDKLPVCLLIFPEGTTYCEETLDKSRQFALKQGLQPPLYSLLPRTLGLYSCVSILNDQLDGIYDFTMAFPPPPSSNTSQDLFYTIRNIYFKGWAPSKVYIHIRYIPRCEIPTEKKAFDDWLFELFRLKDAKLSYFRQNKTFLGKCYRTEQFQAFQQKYFLLFVFFSILSYAIIKYG